MKAAFVAVFALVSFSSCIGAPLCGTNATGLSAVCALDASTPLAAGQALTIQVRESCGSACATNSTFACTASVDGGSIVLSASITECQQAAGGACVAVCRVNAIDCPVPALAAGTYTVTGDGVSASQLVVSASGTASRCAF